MHPTCRLRTAALRHGLSTTHTLSLVARTETRVALPTATRTCCARRVSALLLHRCCFDALHGSMRGVSELGNAQMSTSSSSTTVSVTATADSSSGRSSSSSDSKRSYTATDSDEVAAALARHAATIGSTRARRSSSTCYSSSSSSSLLDSVSTSTTTQATAATPPPMRSASHRLPVAHTNAMQYATDGDNVGGMKACARILQQHRLRLRLHYLTPYTDADASVWTGTNALNYTMDDVVPHSMTGRAHTFTKTSSEQAEAHARQECDYCWEDVCTELMHSQEKAAVAYRPCSDDAGRVLGRRYVKTMHDEPYPATKTPFASHNTMTRSHTLYGSAMTNTTTRARLYESFDRLFHRLLESGHCALDTFFSHPEAPAAAVLLQRVLLHRTPSPEFVQRALLLVTRRPFTPIAAARNSLPDWRGAALEPAGDGSVFYAGSHGSSSSSGAEIGFALRSICHQLRGSCTAKNTGSPATSSSDASNDRATMANNTLYDNPSVRCLLLEALLQEGLYTDVVTVMRETPNRWVTRGLWSALVNAAAQGRLPDSVLLWRLLGHNGDTDATNTGHSAHVVDNSDIDMGCDTNYSTPEDDNSYTRISNSSNSSSIGRNSEGVDEIVLGHVPKLPRISCAGYSMSPPPALLPSPELGSDASVHADMYAHHYHPHHTFSFAAAAASSVPQSLFDVRPSTLTWVEEENDDAAEKQPPGSPVRNDEAAAPCTHSIPDATAHLVPDKRRASSLNVVRWVLLTSNEVAYARVHFMTDTVTIGDGRALDTGVRRAGVAVMDYARELVCAADAMHSTLSGASTWESTPVCSLLSSGIASSSSRARQAVRDGTANNHRDDGDAVEDKTAGRSSSNSADIAMGQNDDHACPTQSCIDMTRFDASRSNRRRIAHKMLRRCSESATLLHFASEGVVYGLDATTATALLLRAGVALNGQSSPLLALAILRRYLATCSALRRELAMTWYRHTMTAMTAWKHGNGMDRVDGNESSQMSDRETAHRAVGQSEIDDPGDMADRGVTIDRSNNDSSGEPARGSSSSSSSSSNNRTHAHNGARSSDGTAEDGAHSFNAAAAVATHRALLQHAFPPDPAPFLVFLQIMRDSHEARSYLDKSGNNNNSNNNNNSSNSSTTTAHRGDDQDATLHASTAPAPLPGAAVSHDAASSLTSTLPRRASVIPMMHWELAWSYFQRLNRENPHWFTGSTAPHCTSNANHGGKTSSFTHKQDSTGCITSTTTTSDPHRSFDCRKSSSAVSASSRVAKANSQYAEQQLRRSSSCALGPDDAEELCRCVLDILCRGADPWMTLAVLRAMSARHLVDGLDMTLWFLHRLDDSHHTSETQDVARKLFYWLLDEVGLHLHRHLQHHLIAVARALIRLSLSEELRLLYNAVLDAVDCFSGNFRRAFLTVLQDVICPACCAPLTSHAVFEERVCGCCLCRVPAKNRSTEWASFELSRDHVRRIREHRRAQRRLARRRLHARLLQPPPSPTQQYTGNMNTSSRPNKDDCDGNALVCSDTEEDWLGDAPRTRTHSDSHDRFTSPYYEAAKSSDAAEVLRRAVLLPGIPLSSSSSPALFTGLLTSGQNPSTDCDTNDTRDSASHSRDADIRNAIAESYRRLTLPREVRRKVLEQRRCGLSDTDGFPSPVVTAALPTPHVHSTHASTMHATSPSSHYLHHTSAASSSSTALSLHRMSAGVHTTWSAAAWVCVWCHETNPAWGNRITCAACGAATGPEATWRVFIYASPHQATSSASHARVFSSSSSSSVPPPSTPMPSASSHAASYSSPACTLDEIRARIAHAAARDEDAIGAAYLLMLYRRLFLLYATPHDVEERILQLIGHLCRLRERVLAAYVYTRFVAPGRRQKDHTLRQLAQLFVGPILYNRRDRYMYSTHVADNPTRSSSTSSTDKITTGESGHMNEDATGSSSSRRTSRSSNHDESCSDTEEVDANKRIDALRLDDLRNDDTFFPAVFTTHTCKICFGEHAWQHCPIVTRDFRATPRASAVQLSRAEKQASVLTALQHAVTTALLHSKAHASHLLVEAYASFVRSPYRELYAQTCAVEVNRLSIMLCECKQYRRAAFVLCHVPLHARWNEAYLRMTHYFNVTEAEAMAMLQNRPIRTTQNSTHEDGGGDSENNNNEDTDTSSYAYSSSASSAHPNFVQVTLTCCMCLDERHASFSCPRLIRWLQEVRELRQTDVRIQQHPQARQVQQQRRRLHAQVDGWTTAGPERLHAWYRFLLDHIAALYDVPQSSSDTRDSEDRDSGNHDSRRGTSKDRSKTSSTGRERQCHASMASDSKVDTAAGSSATDDTGGQPTERAETSWRAEAAGSPATAVHDSDSDILVYAVHTTVLKLVAVRWRSYAYRLYARCPVWCVSNTMTAALLRMNGFHEHSIATLCSKNKDLSSHVGGMTAPMMHLTHDDSDSQVHQTNRMHAHSDVCTSAAARCAAVPTANHCLLCFESTHSFFDCPELTAQPSTAAKLRYVTAHVGQLCNSDGLTAAAAFVYAVYNCGMLPSDLLRGEPALVRDLLDLVHRCLAAGQVMAAVRVLRRLPVELVAPEPTYPLLWRAAGLPAEVIASRRAELLALYDAEGVLRPHPSTSANSCASSTAALHRNASTTATTRRGYSARFFALLNHALHDGVCRHCFLHGHSVTSCPVFHAEVSFGRDYVAAYRMSMMSEQLDREWQDAYLLKLVLFLQTHHAFMPYHIAGVASALNAIAAMWSFRGEPGIALRHLLAIPPAYRRRQAFKHILHSLRVSPAEIARVMDGFCVSTEDGSTASAASGSSSATAASSSSSSSGGFLSAHHLLLPRPAIRDVALRQVFEPFPAAMAALAESEARMQQILAQNGVPPSMDRRSHCGTDKTAHTRTSNTTSSRASRDSKEDAMRATHAAAAVTTSTSWKMQSGGIMQLRDDFDPILTELEDAVGMKLGSRHILFTSAVDILGAVHAAASASSRAPSDLGKGAVEATIVRESHVSASHTPSASSALPASTRDAPAVPTTAHSRTNNARHRGGKGGGDAREHGVHESLPPPSSGRVTSNPRSNDTRHGMSNDANRDNSNNRGGSGHAAKRTTTYDNPKGYDRRGTSSSDSTSSHHRKHGNHWNSNSNRGYRNSAASSSSRDEGEEPQMIFHTRSRHRSEAAQPGDLLRKTTGRGGQVGGSAGKQ